MTERQIAERVVAVTGGGRGIGLATTRALAARGARVAVGDLDADLADQAGGALGAALDVTSRDSFAAFLQRVERARSARSTS